MIRRVKVPFPLYRIDLLEAGDDELARISKDLGLALSPEEMRRIQAYFRKRGRPPTDAELQSLGQAWSEHCCYKSSRPFLREFLFGIEAPSVLLRGDAGVMEFDEDHAYALRIESHNHPSAVEPYGGAATGIGGVLRDVLCMGAKPIALVDPLHFGPLDLPYDALPPGVKHPRYLFGGVVAGIRDYGNRVGVPTVAGSIFFDEGYTGNIIVNVGCVGIARKDRILRNAVAGPGDVFILAGGKTGRDGIHGVTFASLELSDEMWEEWQAGAVQLGDPIMKEPLIHACLEAVDRGLLSGMKDLGGGGLSCVVGEMAFAGGYGAEVHLEKVPLKEPNVAPWEIWVSESQERMMLAVPEAKVDEVLAIFALWDVPATPIGRVLAEKAVRVLYQGEEVLDMDLAFYTEGPEYERPYEDPGARPPSPERPPEEPSDYAAALL
ncbi:MAG: AIR synthase related protein, partial [Candidatus Thermoplasmatota archaeon]|nr:AIR synthase related protein [Candidatus Thermoplasmatota archaeon]